MISTSCLRWAGSATVLGLLSSCVFLGCDEETEGLPGIALQQFSEEFRGATCEHLVACNFMPDTSTCLGVIAADHGIAQSVASANGGRLGYNTDAARACVEAVRNAACTGDLLVPTSVRETCDKVFTGRKGEGEACIHPAECQGLDAACEKTCSDSCCQGACKLGAGTAAIGESCAMKPCAEDAYCKMGADPTCTAKVGPGDSCAESSVACPANYACDPNTLTCFKQADPGGQCNSDLAADGCFHIAEYCDAEAKTCKPLPKPGEPCKSNTWAANVCAFGYAYCDGPTTTCQLSPGEGQPCFGGNYCLGMGLAGITPGLECQNGTCVKITAPPVCP